MTTKKRPAGAGRKQMWPADNVERRPIDKLIPYARNPRTHSDAQVAQIAASMREWGWTNPVLVDEKGGIIAGHGRVMAARLLEWTEVPVMVARGWTASQKRAYVIADNQLAITAGWDPELLGLELRELAGEGFDLSLAGFDDGELARLLAESGAQGLTDPDDAPEAPTEPVARTGDRWVLGRHAVLCDDATAAAAVAVLLGDVAPHLMVTDPPYGVEYDANWRNKALRANGSPTDGRAVGKVINDDRADWREAYELFPGHVAYVWNPPGSRQVEFFNSLVAAGYEVRMQIIWAKSHFPIGRGNYHVQHEPCWYAVKPGVPGGGALGGRAQANDPLANRQAAEIGDRSQHAEAGRVHAPPHREQLESGAGSLRPVPGLGHHRHRCRDDRSGLLRLGDQSRLRRRHRQAVASLHRSAGNARW